MKAASKRIGWGIAAALLGLGAVTACGDDGGGGGGGSGVSGSKTAAEMTDADAKKLCLWTQDLAESTFNISKRDACEVVAQSEASTTSECNTYVTECLSAPEDKSDDDELDSEDCDDAAADDLPDSCAKLTVRDYESCMRGVASAFKKAITSVSCSNVDQGVPSLSDLEDDLPASCDTIKAHCPEILPDLGGDDSEVVGPGFDDDDFE